MEAEVGVEVEAEVAAGLPKDTITKSIQTIESRPFHSIKIIAKHKRVHKKVKNL